MDHALDQAQAPKTRMAFFANNDVIMHGDAEIFRGFDDLFGHLDIGLRGRGVAGGVVVHQFTRPNTAQHMPPTYPRYVRLTFAIKPKTISMA